MKVQAFTGLRGIFNYLQTCKAGPSARRTVDIDLPHGQQIIVSRPDDVHLTVTGLNIIAMATFIT